jgi:3-methyladenine DNA glycosylase/8-oxoguanine DNA glycosylase
LNRLCDKWGPRYGNGVGFPSAADLAGIGAGDLCGLGWREGAARDFECLVGAIVGGGLDLDLLAGLDDAALVRRLAGLPGVGVGAALETALRGFGRLDVAPVWSAGLQAAAQSWLGLAERPGAERLAEALVPWSPFRGMVCFHLLRPGGVLTTSFLEERFCQRNG